MLRRLERWSGWTIVVVAALLPFAVYGALNLPVGSASVHKWLPDNFEERQLYEQFLERFGNDQFLVVTWHGCTADDERVDLLRTSLLSLDNPSHPFIDTIVTTADVAATLQAPPLKLSSQETHRRLKGFLMGQDGTGALVIRLTDTGMGRQRAVINLLLSAADAVRNLGRDELHIAGTVYESYAVDEASEESLKRLVIPSIVLGMVLSWLCLRSVVAAMAVLVIAGIGQLGAIAVVYYSGGYFSAVLIVLPTLVFMLTLSGSVHLMSYYEDVAKHHSNHLGSRAMLLGFKPSLLASVTTSLGMVALATSKLAPVREFGTYSAFCLSLATCFMLLGFPKIADWFVGRRRQQLPSEHTEVNIHTERTYIPSHASPTAQAYVAWLQKYCILVTGIGLLLMAITFIGFVNLKSSTKFDDMFPEHSRVVQDMAWIENRLGPISSVEVLLDFPKNLEAYQQADWVYRVVEQLEQSPFVGGVMSAVTFLPPMPQASSLKSTIERSVYRKKLQSNMEVLDERGWVKSDANRITWRVTAKVSAVADEDYGELTDEVRRAVRSVMASAPLECPFKDNYTGLSPVMHATQLILLRDLGASFSTAFLLITPVMMLIARGFWPGLLIMVPNVLPETLVFGTMAWLGLRLDVAGILTASVAMGIAVNDTLHFVNWYIRRLSLGDSRDQAIADTLTNCAGAMFHTMLISCCSMLPFLLAEFMPTRQFAYLMIAMLSSALLGDLVLLPAMLMSPLGRCLIPKSRQHASDPNALSRS